MAVSPDRMEPKADRPHLVDPRAEGPVNGREQADPADGERPFVLDRASFEELYRRHYAGLVAYARGLLGETAAAEDTVQDVFAAVWRRQKELELRGRFRSYLYSGVRNRALDRLNHAKGAVRHRRPAATALMPSGRPADAGVRHRELASAIEAAIQRLPDRARESFLMSRDGGLSYAEIAEVLEVSVKAVEGSISRALRALRHDLAPFFEQDSARAM